MNPINITHYASKAEATAAAGEALNNLLLENLKVPVLLLLSGGSTLGILDYINQKSMSENLTVTMLDERFSQEAEINNFLQMQKLDFYTLALEKEVSFIGTLPRTGENINDLRSRLEISIIKWVDENPKGKIFATIGMGPDGHIAGIFPYPEDSKFFGETFEGPHWLAAYTAAGKHKYEDRVTATFSFLKNVDEATVFVCGQEKNEKLKKLMEGQTQPHELPALGIYETKKFQIFTDIKL